MFLSAGIFNLFEAEAHAVDIGILILTYSGDFFAVFACFRITLLALTFLALSIEHFSLGAESTGLSLIFKSKNLATVSYAASIINTHITFKS